MVQFKDKGLIILLVVGMLLCVTGAIFAADPESASPESSYERQLRINKNALLQGPTQENSYDAAMALLTSTDGAARKVLTETLAVSDNPAGRRAICSALVSSRISNQTISKKGDFLAALLSMLSTEQSKDAQLAAEAMLIFDFTQHL